MYKLVLENDPNGFEELQSQTFQDAVEESLLMLQWYVINEEEEGFLAVNDTDPNDSFRLREQNYEDSQYELIETLGYYITCTE